MATKGTVGSLLVEMRADLGKLRVDVKEMENVFKTSFGNVQSMAVSFGRILGASFSAGAIIAYGKHIVALGGQLKDLSEQTGISGQTLSGLKSTLEENGTSLDAFAKGIFTLQKNLGGIKNESDPAAQAVKALGLNLDTLRQADTETFLNLVTDALGNVTNPLNRAQLGAQLLGKSFRELGPAIEQISGRLAELRKSGISDEDIAVIDEFGDAWTRVSNKMEVFVAGNLAQTIQDIEHLIQLVKLGSLELRKFFAGATFENRAGLQAQIEELLSPQSHTAVVERAKFKPPIDTASINKLKNEVDSFIASLTKQADALRVNIVELGGGGQAAKAMGLDAEFAAFKVKLLNDNLKMPPDVEKRFNQLKTTILALNVELSKTKEILDRIAIDEADLAEGRKAGETARLAPFKAQDAMTLQRMAEGAALLQRDQDDATAALGEWNEIALKAKRTADELTISFQAIDKEAALMGSGFDATAAKIDAVRSALRNLTSGTEFEEAKTQLRELLNIQAAEKLGAEIGGSISQGLRNTLMGIETGQQTLGEGMKNLLRNMMLELQGAIFDRAFLKPLEAIASGFITGLVGALDTAANDQLKKWAQGLGKQVSSWLGTGLQAILGAFGGGYGGAAGYTYSSGGAGFPTGGGTLGKPFGSGGMIPSFASGGLFIGHGGEFILQKRAVDSIGADKLAAANQSGKLPGGGSVVNVEINGDITPRQPNMTPDQVVKVTAGNITNDGMVMSAIEQRLRMRGR